MKDEQSLEEDQSNSKNYIKRADELEAPQVSSSPNLIKSSRKMKKKSR